MTNSLILFATEIQGGNLPKAPTNADQVQNIMAIVFGIAGALALLMIVISGLRLILSSGDPEKANKARSGIIYALAGLAIAITAESIVYFVVKKV